MTAATETVVKIKINKKHYDAPAAEMTGRELKAFASIPAANKLFKEEPGNHPDRVIGDDDKVRLEKNDTFYDLPPGVVGTNE